MDELIKRALWILVSLALLVGCRGTVQIGIERTPTPDRAVAATLDALLDENHRLATQVAAQVAAIPSSLNLGQLAYVQGGDIWIMTLLDETSRPKRLTTDGRNREPRWSPSGQWLAFRKERPVSSTGLPATVPDSASAAQEQVWLIQADGAGEHSLEQEAAVESFAWSPQNDRLAYATTIGGLRVVNADGTNLVTLIPESPLPPFGEKQVGRIRWSPAGDWIAYEWQLYEWGPQVASPFLTYQGLRIVPSTGGTSIELHDSGISRTSVDLSDSDIPASSESVLVGWSALGAEVLFLQNRSSSSSLIEGELLYAAPVQANGAQSASPVSITNQTLLTYPDFVAPAPLNASGENPIAVAFVAGEGRKTWGNARIIAFGRRITGQDMAAISPAWSPDGQRLAFTAMPDRNELESVELAGLMQRRIWVANAEGNPQPRRLTDASGYRDERPLWSADGSYLLFARMDDRGRTSLWIISSSGGFPRQVVDELTPAPDPLDSYGYVDWEAYFDWWRGP
ncbi:MAG TPA: hypothetical protein VJG32_23530 [Anaerolineae bacterium]|nr:hypothetical protein [Anaerolineae bacterium]